MSTAEPETHDVAPLRQAHAGPVLAPGDEGWDAARAAWNLAVDQRPAAVAVPSRADDIAAAVAFARDSGLGVRAQATGHGAAGPLEGALLLDTSGLRGVEVDAERRIGRVQAGARWADVLPAAAEHGLTGLHGSSRHAGVVGYSLGGGLGPLGRRHGFAANSVTAVELVTADGRSLRASADQEPDLFWALRGGGGSFGVVTALEFRLQPIASAYAGNLFWPLEHARDALTAYARWAATAPDDVTASLRLMRLPPIPQVPEPLRGGAFVNVVATVLGDAERGAELLAPLRDVAPAFLDTFEVVPAAALGDIAGDPEDPVPAIGTHQLVGTLDAGAVETLVALAGPGADTPLLQVELRQLGGALGVSSPEHGALDRVDADFALYAVGLPMAEGHVEAIAAALAGLREALAPWATGRRLFNFVDGEVDSRELYDQATHARLQEIRRRYDPDGVMRPNHPIAAR
jgi:FAD/FMN-containing dehydrogenase